MRFGNINLLKNFVFPIAIALTFHYLCIRKAALGKVKVNFLSARLHYLLIR